MWKDGDFCLEKKPSMIPDALKYPHDVVTCKSSSYVENKSHFLWESSSWLLLIPVQISGQIFEEIEWVNTLTNFSHHLISRLECCNLWERTDSETEHSCMDPTLFIHFLNAKGEWLFNFCRNWTEFLTISMLRTCWGHYKKYDFSGAWWKKHDSHEFYLTWSTKICPQPRRCILNRKCYSM